MTEEQLKELAESYFGIYPERKVLYGTSDGNIFLQKNPAIDHAAKSKPQIKWYEFTRIAGEFGGQDEELGVRTDIDPELEMIAQLKAEALTIDPATGAYRDMYRILMGLHLTAESKKKEDVQTAFANLKAQLEAEAETPAE